MKKHILVAGLFEPKIITPIPFTFTACYITPKLSFINVLLKNFHLIPNLVTGWAAQTAVA
jgi:hypothetical protein